MAAQVSRLCARYVEARNEDPSSLYVRRLAIQIENLDTQIRLANDIAAKVLGVVYLYYRCALTSAQVGLELGLKPPHVRQILWRLAKCWKLLNHPRTKIKSHGGWTHSAAAKKAIADSMRRWHEQRRKNGISWNPHGSKTKAEAVAPALG
jgi:hypothetical protein